MGCVPSWFYVSIECGIAIGRSIAMRDKVAKRRGVSISRPVLAY
ncbi:hypothetical protein HMPREF3190_00832 [Umbribacter vaginalis]|nr:hypothetical protein HMPREF3190_00832 [Coriobacteriales bacterium DNF00809]